MSWAHPAQNFLTFQSHRSKAPNQNVWLHLLFLDFLFFLILIREYTCSEGRGPPTGADDLPQPVMAVPFLLCHGWMCRAKLRAEHDTGSNMSSTQPRKKFDKSTNSIDGYSNNCTFQTNATTPNCIFSNKCTFPTIARLKQTCDAERPAIFRLASGTL